jgi:hypothetical protein
LKKAPLVLSTPEGISATFRFDGTTPGAPALSVAVAGQTAFLFAAYPFGTSKTFFTDLQTSLDKPLTKDGVVYDRLWVGCSTR